MLCWIKTTMTDPENHLIILDQKASQKQVFTLTAIWHIFLPFAAFRYSANLIHKRLLICYLNIKSETNRPCYCKLCHGNLNFLLSPCGSVPMNRPRHCVNNGQLNGNQLVNLSLQLYIVSGIKPNQDMTFCDTDSNFATHQ